MKLHPLALELDCGYIANKRKHQRQNKTAFTHRKKRKGRERGRERKGKKKIGGKERTQEREK